MNGLDLFAGEGIGSLALKHIIPEYRTVCYVEWNRHCQKQLVSRIGDGVLCDAPIWDDVQTFDGKPWREKVDFISAGFPCQPYSLAGKNKGEEDERNRWPETIRIICEVRPRYVFLENVANILTHRYIKRIYADLAAVGYDCEWDVLSTRQLGAPFVRRRLWILCALPGSLRLQGGDEKESVGAWSKQQFERLLRDQLQLAVPAGSSGRVAIRVADRVGRVRAAGNGIVPQVVKRILQVTEEAS